MPTEGLESITVCDVEQFRGFCDAAGITGDKFIPFKAEQLSGVEIPAFIDSLRSVIKKVWSRAEPELGFTDVQSEVTSGAYGYNATINGIWFWFGFYHDAWAQFGNSPVWIGVNNRDNRNLQAIFQALLAIAPAHLHPLEVAGDPNWYLPVSIDPDTHEDAVVEGILRQLRELKRELDTIPP